MRIKAIITIIITSISLIATISLLFFADNNNKNNPTVTTSNNSKYLVKYSSGEVVLFENEKIIEKFDDVNFEILPTEDKLLLEDGIVVSSIADAHRLIEDYDG